MASAARTTSTPPRNGLAGLAHLRHDILAGVVVSLVSLPLSSGIAIASGAPPILGLVSAIIAGLIFPFVGGAYVTISGPAAGLAPALLAIMTALGGAGDADHVGAGYPFLLVVIFLVGVLQMILAVAKLARVAAIIPVCVVEGMLASIGVMIVVKQLPMFCGFSGESHAHEFYQYVLEAPRFLRESNPAVLLVSVSSLALLFFLGGGRRIGLLALVPPQLVAVVWGVVVARVAGLGPGFRISLPSDLLHGIQSPDFSALLARRDLWYVAAMGVITLTLIDGVESLATAMAIDRIDPYRRKSQPNRLLFAMGVSNIASSLVGGLTIIPGGVKSKANIAAGGRTLWANFTNAICLILYLVVARDAINLIPKGALAAVLVHTGYKLCEPLVWRHMAHIGRDQLAVFGVTVVATLCSDLLVGIVVGVIAKLVVNVVLYRGAMAGAGSDGHVPSLRDSVVGFFRNPVARREMRGDVFHLYLDRPLVCFNSPRLIAEVERAPESATSVVVHIGDVVGIVDHTSCENLMQVVEDFDESDRPVTVVGLDAMRTRSGYEKGTHLRATATVRS